MTVHLRRLIPTRARALVRAWRSASPASQATATTITITTTITTRHHSAIPQHNGGDHDADNNGGPSDGDGGHLAGCWLVSRSRRPWPSRAAAARQDGGGHAAAGRVRVAATRATAHGLDGRHACRLAPPTSPTRPPGGRSRPIPGPSPRRCSDPTDASAATSTRRRSRAPRRSRTGAASVPPTITKRAIETS